MEDLSFESLSSCPEKALHFEINFWFKNQFNGKTLFENVFQIFLLKYGLFYFQKKNCFCINILFLVSKKAGRRPHEKSYPEAFAVNIS